MDNEIRETRRRTWKLHLWYRNETRLAKWMRFCSRSRCMVGSMGLRIWAAIVPNVISQIQNIDCLSLTYAYLCPVCFVNEVWLYVTLAKIHWFYHNYEKVVVLKISDWRTKIVVSGKPKPTADIEQNKWKMNMQENEDECVWIHVCVNSNVCLCRLGAYQKSDTKHGDETLE